MDNKKIDLFELFNHPEVKDTLREEIDKEIIAALRLAVKLEENKYEKV